MSGPLFMGGELISGVGSSDRVTLVLNDGGRMVWDCPPDDRLLFGRWISREDIRGS